MNWWPSIPAKSNIIRTKMYSRIIKLVNRSTIDQRTFLGNTSFFNITATSTCFM